MVLAVGDKHNVLILLFLRIKHPVEHNPESITDHSAAAVDAVRRDIVKHHPEETVIKGQGAFDSSGPGKYQQADAVAPELVNNISNGEFCPFQPVWRQILSQHTPGDIEYKDHITACARNRCLLQVPRRPGQADDQQAKTGKYQHCFPAAPDRIGKNKFLLQATVNKALKKLLTPVGAVKKKAEEHGQQPEQEEHF